MSRTDRSSSTPMCSRWCTTPRRRGSDFEGLLAGHPLALSFAAVGELRAGALKNNWGARRLADQQRFPTP
jgi:hypothetical protein